MKNQRWLGLVFVMSLIIGACTRGAAPTTLPEEAPTTAPEAAPTTAPEAAPTTLVAVPGEAARNEALRIGMSQRIEDPTNLNLYAPGVSRSDTGLHQFIYEYFFYQNLQTGEYIPWLAEDFEYNEDFTALTVNLREGVTWSDGEPFTTDDVVFTYDTLRENQGMVWGDIASERVASVEKVDDLTVTFNLSAPSPRFHLNREAFPAVGIWGGITILPQHIWEGQDPVEFKNSDPVGTGPYRLKQATETAMTYERRDDWWAREAFGVEQPAETVSMVLVGSETNAALSLSTNELDNVVIGVVSVSSFEEVAGRNPQVEAWNQQLPYSWLDPCPRALMVQNAHPPLDSPEVRHALSKLINRQAVVDLAYEGDTVSSWGVWPYYDGLQPYLDAAAPYVEEHAIEAFDPARAEELLSQAGVAAGDLNLTYLVNADSTEEMKVSQVIADQLTQAGVQVSTQPLTGGVLADAILRGEYDLKLHSMCAGDPIEMLELFHGKNFVPLGEPAPFFERNSFRYENPEFDALVDQMLQVPPEQVDQILPLWDQTLQIWFEDLPVVPVAQAPALVPFNSTYWTGWPTAEDPWSMPVTWWATFNLVLNGYPNPENPSEIVGGLRPADGG